MTSPLLALFQRSLREDARLKRTYAARAGLIAVVAVFTVFTVIASGWGGAPGLDVFTAIVHIQAAFITLTGLSYFASAITEEKEENMLGLLRMTDLDPLAILLGKSTSRLSTVLLLLAAQFPFTLLAVTLGGIATRQIVASYLALAAYTFFLCNLALLASVAARRTAHAATAVAGVLALFWFAASTLRQLAGSAASFPQLLADGLDKASTSTRLENVLGAGFDGALFSWQFIFNVGAGLIFFGLAWLSFDRACGDGSPETTAGSGAWLRRRLPPGRVWPRAIVWKDACFLHGGRGLAVLKLIAYGLTLAAFFASQWFADELATRGGVAGALFTAAAFAFVAFLIELGLAASRIHRIEVQDGTFPSLSLLPFSMPQIHRAKVQSCYHAVLPSAVWTALPFIGGLVVAATEESNSLFAVVVLIFAVSVFYVLPQVILYFDLVAWLSLKVPRGALPFGIAAMAVANLLGGLIAGITFGVGFIVIPFVAVILAGVFRNKLLGRLEELAADG